MSSDVERAVTDIEEACSTIDAFPSNQGCMEGCITAKGARELERSTTAIRNALRILLADHAAKTEALKPFADFAINVDEHGWTSSIHREAISYWFGPSDFRAALSTSKKETGDGV